MTFASAIALTHRYVALLSQLQSVLGQAEMVAQANVLQQFYRQDWLPALIGIEPPDHRSQWSSAMTEIHRHMRLLSVEMSFVRTARNLATRQQRVGQLDQRLGQIQGFVQVLLKLMSGE